MKGSTILAVIAAATQVHAQCDDDCAQAIASIGIIPVPFPTRTSDCSVFLKTTVTSSTSTILLSTSIDLDLYGFHNFGPTPTPTYAAIPDYASDYCASSADFSSACSCLGVSATTIEDPAATVALFDELPNCVNPGNCDATDGYGDYNQAICASGGGICVPDSVGTGWCISAFNCDSECDSNDDCTTGVCFIGSCCGNFCYDPEENELVTSWGRQGTGGKEKFKRIANANAKGDSPFGKMIGPPYSPVK